VRVIHVLRKPLSTATVAQSLVRIGTGALHIESCRVGARWPSNLILEHLPDCKMEGHKLVRGTTPKGPGAPPAWESGGWKTTSRINAPTDSDGMETVEDWHCNPTCPFVDLDRQSAIMDIDGDVVVGGASRFYLHVGGQRCLDSDE
jgi:hypothetical protein